MNGIKQGEAKGELIQKQKKYKLVKRKKEAEGRKKRGVAKQKAAWQRRKNGKKKGSKKSLMKNRLFSRFLCLNKFRNSHRG